MRRLFFAGIAIAVLAAGPAARFDSWKVIGPGGAGGMFLPTVSPHDSNIVLEHCDMTGGYISLDAGRSWRMFNLRGTISAFAFDPRDPKTIYAGNGALWRSRDTGRTWSMIFPDPRGDTTESMRDDHAAPTYATADPAYPSRQRVRHIAIDPADPQRLYVLFGGGGPTAPAGWLCHSADGGAHWSRVKDFTGSRVHALYFDKHLVAVTADGVWTLAEGTWAQSPAPAGGIDSASGGRGMLYAVNASGIHASQDAGATWRDLADPLPASTKYLSIACSAGHPDTAYFAFSGMSTPDTAPRGWFGIARTSDAGRTWTPVYREAAGKPASNVERAWIEDFYGGTGPVRDLGVSPANPDICYATDACPRSFRTLDGGKTWQQTISGHVDGDRWTTTGFDVTTCYGVHFDPFDKRSLFISYTDVGLFKSSDAGATWKSSIAGIPRKWQNTTYWVEFDPEVKGLMWGAFARTHDLPRPKMWQRMDVDAFGGGVAMSTDGGEHWSLTNSGMPETAVTHIVADPASPRGNRTLYACGFGRGVYKSTDNGRNWILKIDGVEKRQPFAWRIVRVKDGALYLVVSRRSENSIRSDAEDGAVYRSTDGAEHWSKMKLPQGVNGPTGLAVDPADSKRLYLSAWGATVDRKLTGGGIYLSTDAGETWRNIFRDSQHVYDVTIDPRDPNVLYNSGFESGAYRSLDRGSTWTRIRGFNFKWGHRVIPDAADSSKIYVTTFGGSVWHGPAAGDPKATEDIVTPVKVIE